MNAPSPVLLFLGVFVSLVFSCCGNPWSFWVFFAYFTGFLGVKSLVFLRFSLVFTKRPRKRRTGSFRFLCRHSVFCTLVPVFWCCRSVLCTLVPFWGFHGTSAKTTLLETTLCEPPSDTESLAKRCGETSHYRNSRKGVAASLRSRAASSATLCSVHVLRVFLCISKIEKRI